MSEAKRKISFVILSFGCIYVLSSNEAKTRPVQKSSSACYFKAVGARATAHGAIDVNSSFSKFALGIISQLNISQYFEQGRFIFSLRMALKIGAKEFFIHSGLSPPATHT